MQRLNGLGPFYAGLVTLRATGFADAMLPIQEPKVLRNAARFYGLDQPPTPERLIEMGEAWRPFRTWVTALSGSPATARERVRAVGSSTMLTSKGGVPALPESPQGSRSLSPPSCLGEFGQYVWHFSPPDQS